MAVADLPFDLVEVKFAAPLIRAGTVAKADVIERLCTAPSPFATVVAPAGYGKTTLLARWAEADPRRFAWVALDTRDDDAVMFLRYIAVAIHRVEPLAPEVFDALSGPGGSALAKRVPRVGSALAALERPLVLVLDDLHAVANPSCLDVLAALLEYVPVGSQIAIASREVPELPLARWRAQGAVHEIGVADLRLDEQEAGLAAAGRGSRARTRRALRVDRAHGGMARRLVPRGAVDAGRRAKLRERRALRRRRPIRVGVFPLRAAVATAAGRGAVSPVHARCWTACVAACATPCCRRAGRPTRSRRSSARTASWCRSTGAASGIATTTCSGAAAQRARAQRAGRGVRAQRSGDGLVHRQRPDRSGGRSTGTLRVRRTPSQSWSRALPCRSTSTAGCRPPRSGWGGSARTSWCSILHSRSTERGSAC